MTVSDDMTSAAAVRAWLWLAALAVFVLAVSAGVAHQYGRSRAIADLMDQGHTEANLKVALLRAVLERPRAMPVVLADDREVAAALETKMPDTVNRLNQKLENLVRQTQVAVIYVVGADGIAIAASNWRERNSFVGNDYNFREYFRSAMKSGRGEHFALGSVSKRPGLYISRRIGPADAPLGVVVVKVEFDALEADWRDTGRPTYVVDRNGAVLITSVPSWRFMTTLPLPKERLGEIRRSLQFGDAPLQPLPFHARSNDGEASEVEVILPGSGERSMLRLSAAVGTTAWTLEYLLPIEPAASAAARGTALYAVIAVLPFFAIAALILWRRQAAMRRLARVQSEALELERRVHERTEDLSRARDMLQVEIEGHRATEKKLQVVQQDLVAANRLAILGQVAAGVAHEINQPVATIRAYADNAKVFLARDQASQAADNMVVIGELTERIGAITEELKAFARKGKSAPEPIVLQDAIGGAIMLLRSRFSGRMEALDIASPPDTIRVMANRVRLEQVLINLFQNALEALDGRTDGRVLVRAVENEDSVIVTVEDNGPGIPDVIRDELFTPFNTSKERGLGLGLVITKEILTDYGGSIAVRTGSDGTCFTVILKRA